MKKTVKRSWLILGAAAVMLSGTPGDAYGAASPISVVSIRVDSKIEAGSDLPEIDVGDESVEIGEIRVGASNSKYMVIAADWVDQSNQAVKVADEPRMKVTLEPVEVSEDYFLASYKSSSVKISGGTFVSASRQGDNLSVILRIKPVSGEYDPPLDAFWNEKNLGEARWEKPENTSGYYELQLRRGTKTVFRVAKLSSASYNFYPYMTQGGDYSFWVRTIPGTETQRSAAKKSDWIESGELNITERDVSDGKGQQMNHGDAVPGTLEPVGWNLLSGSWYYRYPDGTFCRSKWESIEGQWYRFDGDGRMLLGWQTVNGGDYYLHSNGQMAVGWTRIDGLWYYFRPEEETGYPVGTMVKAGWRVIGSYYYYFNANGSLYTGWLLYNQRWFYFNTVDHELQGAMFTGWIKREEKTYYANSNGEMVTGWWQIDGSWYYFYPDSGEMAKNVDINGFLLDQDGIWR